jgi:hypothetical protein
MEPIRMGEIFNYFHFIVYRYCWRVSGHQKKQCNEVSFWNEKKLKVSSTLRM